MPKYKSIASSLLTFGAFVTIASAMASAASCGAYTPVGPLCERTVVLGWGTAGQGTRSVIEFISRPQATGSVTFQFNQLSSSLGSSYGGYFGVAMSVGGAPAATFANGQIPSLTLQPGNVTQAVVTETCFNASCNVTPPAGLVSNMFSLQLTILAASGADLDATPLPLLTIQFLNSTGAVNYQEQEQGLDASGIASSARTSVNEGASAQGRYYAPNGAFVQPFTAFSVTNPSATSTLNASIVLYDFAGDLLATVPLPTLAPLAAVGYLLVGQSPGDPLGLIPFDTLLPSGADSIFHGVYGVQANGPVVFLSQEYYGNSMLNAYIVH
jgi:hypothetical protein